MKQKTISLPKNFHETAIEDRNCKYIEYIEYSAYESLERKLAIAVEALNEVLNCERTEMDVAWNDAKEALEKIKGEK